MRRLMAITDRARMGDDFVGRIVELAESLGPALIVQVREKDVPGNVLFSWIERLVPRLLATKSQLVINDRIDVARCFSPNVGVHLPERSVPPADARRVLGPGAVVGVSIHRASAITAAVDAGATYVTLSPIFLSPEKGVPLGVEELRTAVERAGRSIEVFALGGVDPSTAVPAWSAGVDGIAAIRAAWDGDVHDRARLLLGA